MGNEGGIPDAIVLCMDKRIEELMQKGLTYEEALDIVHPPIVSPVDTEANLSIDLETKLIA